MCDHVVEGGVRGWHGVTKCGDPIVPNSQLEGGDRKDGRPSTTCRSCARPTSSTRRDLVVYLAKQLVAGELQHKPVVAEPGRKAARADLDGATLFTHLISNVPGMSAAKATAAVRVLRLLRRDLAAAKARTDLANAVMGGADRRVRQEEGGAGSAWAAAARPGVAAERARRAAARRAGAA